MCCKKFLFFLFLISISSQSYGQRNDLWILSTQNSLFFKEGKVGKEVTPDEAKQMAQLCALNALAAISLVADIDQVERIVRVGGFVNGIAGFTSIPPIINGASELFIKLFGEVNGKHARTAIGVAELPLNSPVEVEVLVALKN